MEWKYEFKRKSNTCFLNHNIDILDKQYSYKVKEMAISIARNDRGREIMKLLMGNQETNDDETWFSVEIPMSDVIALIKSCGYIVKKKN